MGKNDVEILLKSKDATAPGIDSARARLQKFGSDSDKLVGGTIKLGAAVAGLQGAFGVANAAVAFFRGDMNAVGDALERLPLGIGSIVREFRDFADSFNEPTRKAEELKKKLDDLREQTSQVVGQTEILKMSGLDKDLRVLKDAERNEVRALEKKLVDSVNGVMPSLEASNSNVEILAQIRAVKERYAIESDIARDADFEREKAKAAARKASFEKEKQDEKKQADELSKIREEAADKEQKRLARKFSGTGPGGSLFGDERMNAAMAADQDAIQAARAAAQGGGGGFASGEQSRFLTGLTASARESQARVQNDQLNVQKAMLKKLEDVENALKEANKPADPSTQLNLTVGALGGLS